MLSKQSAVLLQRPLPDGRQRRVERVASAFITDGFQRARGEADVEDSLHGRPLEGAVAQRVYQRLVNVFGQVVLLETQDVACVGAALFGMRAEEPRQEGLRLFAEGEERLADRFQAVASPPGSEVVGILDALSESARETLVLGDEHELGTVEEDLALGCFDGQDVGDIVARNRVEVGLELHHPAVSADAQRHFGCIVGTRGQRLEIGLFGGEALQWGLPRGAMDVAVAFLGQPPPGGPAQIVGVLERSAAEQVGLDVAKRDFNLTFRLWASRPAGHGLTVVMGDERRKGGVEDGPAGFPAQDHGPLVIIQTVPGNAAKIFEGVAVPADERIEIAGCREVDVVAPGVGQDVGEAPELHLACAPKRNRVEAPVHLALLAGLGLEADDRLLLARQPQLAQKLAHDRDPARIAGLFAQLLVEAGARDVRVILEDLLDLWPEGIELARSAPSALTQRVMPLLALIGVSAKNPPHGVAGDAELAGQRPDACAAPRQENDPMGQILATHAASRRFRHLGLPGVTDRVCFSS